MLPLHTELPAFLLGNQMPKPPPAAQGLCPCHGQPLLTELPSFLPGVKYLNHHLCLGACFPTRDPSHTTCALSDQSPSLHLQSQSSTEPPPKVPRLQGFSGASAPPCWPALTSSSGLLSFVLHHLLFPGPDALPFYPPPSGRRNNQAT